MNKFLYQINKKERENGIEISRFYVDKELKNDVKYDKIPYRLVLKEKDFKKIKIKNEKIKLSDRKLMNYNKEKVVEILIEDKELFDYMIQKSKELDFETYEEDLPPEHKYIIDNKISLAKQDYNQLKYVSIDIETVGDINNQEIVLISAYSPYDGLSKVYINKENIKKENVDIIKKRKFEDFDTVILDDEKQLLEGFCKEIIDFDPQVIVGWNVIDFDFKIIKRKCELYDIEFRFNRFNGETRMRIISDFFKNSTMSGPGLIVFDVINLLRMNFIEFDDYKLNTVAKEVLDDEKIDLENDENADNSMEDKINAINNMFENDIEKLIEYNFKDSLLTSQILEKLKLMDLMCKRSILTNTPLEKVKSPIATLDLMYLEKLHKKGYIAATNRNYQDTSPIEGAYVINPKQGFYEDVYVLDFKSLYPSIIMTFNIDPFTYSDNGDIKAPNGAFFDRERGILPGLIKDLIKERDIAKKEKDDVKSFALKITMNSFYGAIASPKSRFYNKEVGEAITSFGREIIKKSKEFIEKQTNHEVIYGDTDSIFIKSNSKTKTKKERFEEGKGLEEKLNKFFTNWVEEDFKQENFLIIELEKVFKDFFIASKKRYVGFDEITQKNIFVGMEAIRGDWTDLAKNFQKKLIDIIFETKDNSKVKEFIFDYIQELKKGKYDNLLVYTKKITKPLELYTKTTPPHVRAAREVKNFDGRIVKYVMTKGGPKHLSLITSEHELDYEHYIDKQLKGVSDDILDSLNLNFDKIMYSKKQKSLDGFF